MFFALACFSFSLSVYTYWKVLKKAFIVDSGNVTRAVAEKQILQSLQHPFIVRLYWAFQSEEHLFLVLNHVGGGEMTVSSRI